MDSERTAVQIRGEELAKVDPPWEENPYRRYLQSVQFREKRWSRKEKEKEKELDLPVPLVIEDCLVQIGGDWFRFDGFDEDGDYWLERIVPTSGDFDKVEYTEDYRALHLSQLLKSIKKFAKKEGGSLSSHGHHLASCL